VDAGEYLLNAQYLDVHHHLPPDYVSYEYSAPPLFEALAVPIDHLARWLPSIPLEAPWNVLTRALWLMLVVASAWCLTAAGSRRRIAGAVAAVLAVAWGLDEAISLAGTEAWSAGQLLALAAGLGLLVTSGSIARELWPAQPRRVLATVAFVAAYPVVLRMSVLFHPETTMAFLSALVILVVIRADRRGWPVGLGVLTGVLCGLDLLARQSAVVVCACVAAVAILAAGRKASRFLASAALALALVAGPWLGYAAHTWGNPLQGNLQRPTGGMMVSGEPASFYVSFPVASLVTRPYRPSFENDFLPKLHADLWSDWYGGLHAGVPASRAVRITASIQSVFGLVADVLALIGLGGFGAPAFLRLLRRRSRGTADLVGGFLALVAVAGAVAFLAQIVRYPQTEGREIKASYLLFTAPCWAIFSVQAWLWLKRSWARWNVILTVLAILYAGSYAATAAANLSLSYDPRVNLVVPSGYVDLRTSIQALNTARVGTEADFAVFVQDAGTEGAVDTRVEIRLDPDMSLLARPYTSEGSGCTGTRVLECSLGLVAAGTSAQVRLAVRPSQSGVEALIASATAFGTLAHTADDARALYVVVP
jgi:hypothetical protein